MLVASQYIIFSIISHKFQTFYFIFHNFVYKMHEMLHTNPFGTDHRVLAACAAAGLVLAHALWLLGYASEEDARWTWKRTGVDIANHNQNVVSAMRLLFKQTQHNSKMVSLYHGAGDICQIHIVEGTSVYIWVNKTNRLLAHVVRNMGHLNHQVTYLEQYKGIKL